MAIINEAERIDSQFQNFNGTIFCSIEGILTLSMITPSYKYGQSFHKRKK